MTDGLFPEPAPGPAPKTAAERADAAVARRIVTSYYTGQAEEARKALEAAQAAYDQASGAADAWTERGEITPDVLAGGRLDMTVLAIVGHADSLWNAAMKAAIPQMGGTRTPDKLAAADQAQGDAAAVRRWMVDQGHATGDTADLLRESDAFARRNRPGKRGKRDGSL